MSDTKSLFFYEAILVVTPYMCNPSDEPIRGVVWATSIDHAKTLIREHHEQSGGYDTSTTIIDLEITSALGDPN